MTPIQKACRVETAKAIFALDRSWTPPAVLENSDDISFAWLKAKCALCGACPDMLRYFGLAPEEARAVAQRAGPRLRLVA